MRRNGTVDYLKFMFSLVILLFHFGLFFDGGYIMVEGFFMITGYLMMTSLTRKRGDGEDAPDSTAKFVFRKYTAIFFPLLFSAISGTLIYEFLIYKDTVEEAIRKIPLLLFEVFPAQNAGFSGFWATGVSWYLAAMLLSIAILHPFVKKNPLRFAYTAAPVISILVYGLLCHQMKSLSVPNSWIYDLVNTGLLRGIAGISMGCVLYALISRSTQKVSPGMRIFGTVAALAGFWYLFRVIMDEKQVRTTKDFILVAVIFGILYVCLSGKTVFSLLPSNAISKAFATVSTYIFLNHYAWCRYFHTRFPERDKTELVGWFLLCVAVSSLVAWGLTTLANLLVKKVKEAKKRKAEATSAEAI